MSQVGQLISIGADVGYCESLEVSQVLFLKRYNDKPLCSRDASVQSLTKQDRV